MKFADHPTVKHLRRREAVDYIIKPETLYADLDTDGPQAVADMFGRLVGKSFGNMIFGV